MPKTESSSALPGYTIVIAGAPFVSQAPASALSFCHALINSGHSIDRVFLYGDGVALASALNTPPSDETDWTKEWQELLHEHDIPATACIASCLRRGLLDKQEAARYQKSTANLASGFSIAGLGEWVEAQTDSDRVIYFPGGD